MKEKQVTEDGLDYVVQTTQAHELWRYQGELHRVSGPALISLDGSRQEWYQHGKRHRLDGPAIIYTTADSYWYYEGVFAPITNQQAFEQWLKLKVFT